ncbi:hypothetical protein GALL_460950 [mine drainage metagenome]|uniref:Uncharacterized protein n=1 Tax=mine drainage metagenome TaxID=410659 RepID=A0A1J5PWT1_9ZZZZ
MASALGPACASLIARGVKPRARRMNRPPRSTLSSQRATMSRSCVRKASAMPERRAKASSLSRTSGSPPGLALVAISASGCGAASQSLPEGRPAASWKSRYWIGVAGSIVPSQASPGATPARRWSQPARFLSSTIGRSGQSSRAASSSPSSARSLTEAALASSSAKGFSSRALRSRSRATAAASSAAQTRWKPPRPLIATMPPARIRRSVSATGSPAMAPPRASRRIRRGPQAGQQLVSAWKRRSPGSRYSRAHAGHSGNGARLVLARS